MNLGILEPKDFSKNALNELEKRFIVSQFDGTDLDKFISDKDVLFVRLGYQLDSSFFDTAKKLKVLCSPTTGLNHICLEECKRKEIEIVSLKGEVEFLSTIRATPEHTFGLVLSLLRNYNKSFLSLENSEWNREIYKGHEIFGNKIGIIGYGRVGKILANYFTSFGANVYFYDIDKEIDYSKSVVKCSSINELIEKTNIVILSASYSEENKEFFDKKYIDLLENKYFINTARGELIDENYLIKKIEENLFKGIALDVIQNEQTNNNLNKMLELTKKYNFIITPHIAGATYTSMYRTEEYIAQKLIDIGD